MPRGDPPAGTVTFLFTDIEGSTRLWEAHPEAMRTSLARHDDLMRQAIASAGGHVFKTIGDGFCAAFATAPQGLDAVLAAQSALTAEPWPEQTPIKVRMALHTGAVESRDDDYFGPPLNRVARLLGAAHGGQCLLSQATFELVRDFLPAAAGLRDLGTHQLKDLARSEQVFQLLHPSLRDDFPALRSLSQRPNNLPLQLTSFVGREAEIGQVTGMFGRSRMVTLTGAGGSGKTRLSIQAAADLLESKPDGVWFVELATVTDPDGLERAVAAVLSVNDDRDVDLRTATVRHIGSKQLLLILDNCEHIIEDCARFADSLLRACPEVRILATSREPLGIAGESTFRVPPLAVPDTTASYTPTSLSQFAAVRLFIDRAVQAEPGFSVTNDNAPAVASVCCQLDGIPLAIELAAARVRSLPIEQIESRLDQRFLLLTGGSRVALPRQQTLRALIDWSYDLLLPREKAVLQRLSVFSGGWTLEAAEDVCSDHETEGWEVTEIVLSLADKSLVVVQERVGGHRYSLLESIREYARDRLSESGGQSLLEDRHLRYFARLAVEAMTGLRGPEQKEWFERLDPDHDNFRAALRRGAGTERGLELAGSHWWYWYYRGHLTEGRSWLTSVLDQNPDGRPELRARALNGAGVLAEYQGDDDLALALLHESAEISRERGDQWLLAMALNNIGNVHSSNDDFLTAESFWTQAYETWLEMESEGVLNDVSGLAASVDNLGNVARLNGRLDEARELYLQGFELRQRAGNRALAAYSLVNLGALEVEAGNRAAALEIYHRGLKISSEMKDSFAVGYFLSGLAALAEPAAAARLLGRWETLREELGVRLSSAERLEQGEVVAQAEAQIGHEAVAAAWAEGRSMSLANATDLALQVGLVTPD